jgi:hypothetical protein
LYVAQQIQGAPETAFAYHPFQENPRLPLTNKIVGMADNGGQTFVMEILKVFTLGVGFSTERRYCQRSKESVYFSHG